MKIKLIYVVEKKVMLHPDSIEAWNDIAGASKQGKMMNK